MQPMASVATAVRTVLVRLGLAQAPRVLALGAGSEAVADKLAETRGGLVQPIPRSELRWYIDNIETAAQQCDMGNISMAARLMRAASSDGVLSGVMSTRTSGLVRLPKRFRGDPEMVQALTGGELRARSVFAEMCPDSELALLAGDGDKLGVGIAEMLEVSGRPHRRLTRLEPEFLRFSWAENQWYYQSIGGQIPITPGDGRWVLHQPGGLVAPWQSGMWMALGRAYIRKDHAALSKDNWEAKLAHPARVAIAALGASADQAEGWFRKVMAWGINTVFGLMPGYDVKLLESNGVGAESFRDTIAEQNREMMILVTGQTVTTDGGTGFANADIHKSIRADLIKATADGLAHTINTQVLPAWVLSLYGEDALTDGGVVMEWDVTPPKDRNGEATALVQTANAITQLTEALAPHGMKPDVRALADRFAVPVDIEPAAPMPVAKPALSVVPTKAVAA